MFIVQKFTSVFNSSNISETKETNRVKENAITALLVGGGLILLLGAGLGGTGLFANPSSLPDWLSKMATTLKTAGNATLLVGGGMIGGVMIGRAIYRAAHQPKGDEAKKLSSDDSGSDEESAESTSSIEKDSPTPNTSSNVKPEESDSSEEETTSESGEEEKVEPKKDSAASSKANPLMQANMVKEILSHLQGEDGMKAALVSKVFANQASFSQKQKEAMIDMVCGIYKLYSEAIKHVFTNGSGRRCLISYKSTEGKTYSLLFAAGKRCFYYQKGAELMEKHYKANGKMPEGYQPNIFALIQKKAHKKFEYTNSELARSAKDKLPQVDRVAIGWFEDMVNIDVDTTQIESSDLEKAWPTEKAFRESLIAKMDKHKTKKETK